MLWAAAWLHKASRRRQYREYIVRNEVVLRAGDTINEFGWDNKHAGINVLISKVTLTPLLCYTHFYHPYFSYSYPFWLHLINCLGFYLISYDMIVEVEFSIFFIIITPMFVSLCVRAHISKCFCLLCGVFVPLVLRPPFSMWRGSVTLFIHSI